MSWGGGGGGGRRTIQDGGVLKDEQVCVGDYVNGKICVSFGGGGGGRGGEGGLGTQRDKNCFQG